MPVTIQLQVTESQLDITISQPLTGNTVLHVTQPLDLSASSLWSTVSFLPGEGEGRAVSHMMPLGRIPGKLDLLLTVAS